MSDEASKPVAEKAEDALLEWLRGDTQHVQLVTTNKGERLILRWEEKESEIYNAN